MPIRIVTLIATLLISSIASAYELRSLSDIQATIAQLKKAVPGTEFGTQMLQQSLVYRGMTNEQFENVRGLHVNVIITTANIDPIVQLQAQERIELTLEKLVPRVVSTESLFSEPLEIDTAEKDTRVMLELQNIGYSSLAALMVTLATSAVVDYVVERKMHGVGAEEKYLGAFTQQTYLLRSLVPQQVALLDRLDERLDHLRSEIALARTLRAMRAQKASSGTLVMGTGHEKSLRDLARALDLSASFYCVYKELPLSQTPC